MVYKSDLAKAAAVVAAQGCYSLVLLSISIIAEPSDHNKSFQDVHNTGGSCFKAYDIVVFFELASSLRTVPQVFPEPGLPYQT